MDVSDYKDKISSICCDHLMTDRIFDSKFFHQELGRVCDFARKNEIVNITIPLLEEAEVTSENCAYLLDFLHRSLMKHGDLKIHLEVDCKPSLALVLASINDFGLVFDTGNITSSGHDPVDWLNMNFDVIDTIHLKDRTKDPVMTVEPFTGDTDFEAIFKLLAEKSYDGLFTIQTARGETGKEQETIRNETKETSDTTTEQNALSSTIEEVPELYSSIKPEYNNKGTLNVLDIDKKLI